MDLTHLNILTRVMHEKGAEFYESHFDETGSPLEQNELEGAFLLAQEMLNLWSEIVEIYGNSIPSSDSEQS